jgi:hypothetical protein
MAQTGKRNRERPLPVVKSASTYDKRIKLQKQAALNAAKVNKYRKLKAKLTADVAPTLLVRNQPAAAPGPRAGGGPRSIQAEPLPQAFEEADQHQRAGAKATSQPSGSAEEGEPQEQSASADAGRPGISFWTRGSRPKQAQSTHGISSTLPARRQASAQTEEASSEH